MSYRLGRVAHIIRDVVSDSIANRISDPRVSRFASVTRVEMSEDLHTADVYVSVMGDEAEGRTTMKGLESARGMIQTRVAKSVDMRHCPIVRLHLDMSLKKAAEVIHLIDKSVGPTTQKSPDESESSGKNEPVVADRSDPSPTNGDGE